MDRTRTQQTDPSGSFFICLCQVTSAVAKPANQIAEQLIKSTHIVPEKRLSTGHIHYLNTTGDVMRRKKHCKIYSESILIEIEWIRRLKNLFTFWNSFHLLQLNWKRKVQTAIFGSLFLKVLTVSPSELLWCVPFNPEVAILSRDSRHGRVNSVPMAFQRRSNGVPMAFQRRSNGVPTAFQWRSRISLNPIWRRPDGYSCSSS